MNSRIIKRLWNWVGSGLGILGVIFVAVKLTEFGDQIEVSRFSGGTFLALLGLAGIAGHCIECHTPMTKDGRRDYANRIGAGGFVLDGPWGHAVTANITPDKETGIGTWSDAQIKRAITKGVRAEGGLLGPPMGFSFYVTIKDEDLDANVAYLRSLKPVKNQVR